MKDLEEAHFGQTRVTAFVRDIPHASRMLEIAETIRARQTGLSEGDVRSRFANKLAVSVKTLRLIRTKRRKTVPHFLMAGIRAVMIEVLHEIAPQIRPAVMGAAARTLKAGGWMVIIDETYPSKLDEARRPEFRFPLQTGFEELIWGNVIPTREEQETLLRDAGLRGPVNRELIGEGFTVLTTRR